MIFYDFYKRNKKSAAKGLKKLNIYIVDDFPSSVLLTKNGIYLKLLVRDLTTTTTTITTTTRTTTMARGGPKRENPAMRDEHTHAHC